MTNQELLGLNQTLNQHADVFKTASGKYAVIKNMKKIQRALKPYYETLQELSEECDLDLSSGTIPDDAPESFMEDVNDLLQEKADVKLHNITEKTLQKEEEKGNNIDINTLVKLQKLI